jgi:hypothetical protein
MLRCLANRILGQAARAPGLVLDHDACLVLTPRAIEQQRAMRRSVVQQGVNALAVRPQKSSTLPR